MKYELILLDCDRTIFDFDKAEEMAMKMTFDEYGLVFSTEIYEVYQGINNHYWSVFEKGQVEKKELMVKRFVNLFDKLAISGVPPEEFNDKYLNNLGKGTYLYDDAKEVCNYLAKTKTIVIATNGNEKSQMARIANSEIAEYVSYIAISESAGYPKPDKRFFQYALNLCRYYNKEKVLMIGDSLEADIKGGMDFGVDTCWFNPASQALPEHIKPTYIIKQLKEIYTIVE